jgi:Tol biopolymer transport system component/predicted Ser/Thr protein kinase
MLDAGDKLGPYEILAPLGEGGMGQVWKARDTRLDRIVALKVSKREFTERFEREARAISALNHPHICQLYDVGPNYLVMEFAEGEPLLSQRKPRPLPLEKALEYSRQILDALDHAHRHKITHRDLKPANIMITRQGVKLLDFGLAKFETDPLQETDETITQTLTRQGQIVGTLPYMSPEQLVGKPADARSDIFSFGAVLYEMLSGERAFEGSSAASLIAAVLERQPAPLVSPPLDRVVRRALAKDPDQRFQTARDLKTALEWAMEPQAAGAAGNGRRWLWTAAAALVAGGALAGAWGMARFRQPAAADRVLRLDISPPQGGRFVTVGNTVGGSALSPDGRMVAFVAAINGKTGLWVRALDDRTARPLPGTEGAADPFWSPDGKSIAFAAATSALQRIDLAGGGLPVTIGGGDATRGMAWSDDGQILFGSPGGGLFRVPATGGTPSPLTQVDGSRGESSHRFPQVLPGGRFLYWAWADKPENSGVYVSTFAKPAERAFLLRTETAAIVAPGGDGRDYLLWLRGGTLVAQEFDTGALKLRGEAHAIAGPIPSVGIIGTIPVSASASGQLLYNAAGSASQLTWFDRAGALRAPVGEEYMYNYPFRLSPDGHRAVATHDRPGGNDLWLQDVERGSASRFTSASTLNIFPVWSPDGRTILFTTAAQRLFRKDSGGVSEEQGVTEGRYPPQYATDWSRDGQFLIYVENGPGTQRDLWVLPFTPEGKVPENTKPWPYLRTKFNEGNARFLPKPSPRWVAYQSDKTGRYEVYIQRFPEGRDEVPISTGGGLYPVWGADGRELFYLAPGNKLMAVDLAITSDRVLPSTPRALFTLPIIDNGFSPYDTINGQRFLVRAVSQQASSPLTVIFNWPALLKKGAAAP